MNVVKTEILNYGFPLLTQNNVSNLREMRQSIYDLKIQNLTKVGIMSSEGLFFHNKVIQDAYRKIENLISE